jgi:hypothetical protein
VIDLLDVCPTTSIAVTTSVCTPSVETAPLFANTTPSSFPCSDVAVRSCAWKLNVTPGFTTCPSLTP